MGKGASEDASGAGAGSSGAASREARAATMLEGRGGDEAPDEVEVDEGGGSGDHGRRRRHGVGGFVPRSRMSGEEEGIGARGSGDEWGGNR